MNICWGLNIFLQPDMPSSEGPKGVDQRVRKKLRARGGYSLYWGIHVCVAQMPLFLAIFLSLCGETSDQW